MAATDSVGSLEEESLKRKERLKALKRKFETSENDCGNAQNENSNSVDLPRPKFRSYRPQDEKLKEQIIEDAKPGNVENEVKEQLEAASSKVVIEELTTLSENNCEGYGEEFEGEKYVPYYVCLKKTDSDDEICESETSCSEARTTTGNILHRMIKDPENRRPPCLGKWPSYTSKSTSDFEENVHQFRAAQQPTPLAQMCSLRITSEPNAFRQPVIVGTIGPSSTDVENILELLEAGMNIARINMAHANPCNILEPFRNVIEAGNRFNTLTDFNVPIATMMDLKGPEIRTGKIYLDRNKKESQSEIHIREGAYVRLTSDELFRDRCTDKIIYVNYAGLLTQMTPGNPIYISDGQIKLTVDSIETNALLCVVDNGGTLRSDQKVRVPMLPALLPAISNYDLECLKMAVEMDVDVVVVPMTRNFEVIKQIKKILGDDGKDILVFAKISSFEGLENIDDIIKAADGIVVQKNDLTVEILPEKMFIAQKQIIAKCNRVRKPVLCTAELCSSKSASSALRRVEINDISNAIIDGADGIVLIPETATGDEGVDVIRELSKVLREAEAVTMQKPYITDLANELTPSIEPSNAIALAAVQIANKIQAAAILTVTTSGKTAQLLSWFRPRRPVIAITRVGKVSRQMNLWRAVLPLHFTAPTLPDWFQDVKARFEYGISYGKSQQIIESGDLLVLVSGYRKMSGFTNCIRIVFASAEPTGLLDNVSSYYGERSKESSVIFL